MNKKLLVVEDEKRMAEAIQQFLIQEGYNVDVSYDGITGAKSALAGEYDLYILDVMLPGKSGFTIASDIRKEGIATPILFLTAKSSIEDKINGFDLGGDDYLTKPFDSRELLARIRALLKRSGITENTEIREKYRYKDLILKEEQALLINLKTGEEMKLLGKEFFLLEYFFQNPEQILSKEQISDHIWRYDSETEYNNVEVYISFIRKKLQFVHSTVEIKTYRGMGYAMQGGNVHVS
ncbi:MAG: response regulator transcription factor [Eubacteriales bacterium]|nr:response regulator transcription factor [Eubacteriales bacterium]